MAEETNPWKRQMMNRQNNNNNLATSNTQSPSTPSTGSNNMPSDMTNPWKQKLAQQNSSPSQPQVKKNETNSPQTSINPWKSGAIGGGSIANNPWMKGKIDKEKQLKQKQEQQRLRRQEQQRKRLQQEEIQKQKKEQQLRQKQKQNQRREMKQMQIEETLSRQFQRKVESQLKEQQNQRKKQEQKKKSPSKVSPQKKINLLSKQPKLDSQYTSDTSLAYKYINSFQTLCSDYEFYTDKLKQQKLILNHYKEFWQLCASKVKSIVDSHEIPTIVKVDDDITLKFIKSKSNRTTEDTITYDQGEMQRVQRQMNVMNIIQNAVIQLLRKHSNIYIRTPLIALIEYRGILCVCTASTKEQQSATAIQASKLPRMLDQVTLLLKQVNKYESSIKIENLILKTITNTNGQQIFIIYLKEGTNIPQVQYEIKPYLLTKDLGFLQRDLKLIVQSQILEKYSHANQYENQLINSIILSKHIVQIYRSAQGEIEEQNFMRVVIKMQKQFSQILEDSGFKGKCEDQKGILLILIEKLTGIILQFEDDVFQTLILTIKQIIPLFKGYSFSTLQCVDISNKCLTFAQDNKTDLVTQSIQLKFQLDGVKQPSDKISLKLKHAQILYAQEKNSQSQKQLPYTLEYLRMLELLIKNQIILDRQNELLQNFNTFIAQINFIFGQQNFLSSQIYCLVAFFYSKRLSQVNEALTLYQLALNINDNLFGVKSVESGDIYLAMAHTYLNHKRFQQSKSTLQKASVIYQELDSKLRKIQVISFLGEIAYQEGDKKLGDQLVSKAIRYYQKIHKANEIYRIQTLRLFFEKDGIMRQQIIHDLFQLGMNYNKTNIMKEALVLAMRQELPQLSRIKLQKLKQIQSNENEEGFVAHIDQFMKHVKNFSTMNQMIRWMITLLDAPGKSEKADALFQQLVSFIGKDKFNLMIS